MRAAGVNAEGHRKVADHVLVAVWSSRYWSGHTLRKCGVGHEAKAQNFVGNTAEIAAHEIAGIWVNFAYGMLT